MAKRTWNPGSAVNQNHVTGMIAKGDSMYHDWVGRIFEAKAEKASITDLVIEGQDCGYLSDTNAESLLGTKDVANVKAAAADEATRTMVHGMLQGGLDSAIEQLVKAGTVSKEMVTEVKASIAAEAK